LVFNERIYAYENETDVEQLNEKNGDNCASRKNSSYKKQHTIYKMIKYEKKNLQQQNKDIK
jgi:hypothetical protein